MNIQKQLLMHKDPTYCDFLAKLIPTINKKTILGVRTPDLRSLAKQLHNTPEKDTFLHTLPHSYFEENQLHIFLIEQEKDAVCCQHLTEMFLPYVDNWATCDQFSPKSLAQHKDTLLNLIKQWLRSEHTYTVRFGLNMLMRYFLDQDFQPEYLAMAADADGGDYYIKMMVAWFFATALAKQYDAALPYLQQRKLSEWTHGKTIQKAIESRRITVQQKEYLKTLKKQS